MRLLVEVTEGIVLKSIDYKENQRIITVFSKDLGIISLIVKGITPTAQQKLVATTPLCQAEFHFIRGRSELLRLSECTILTGHHELRQKLSHLQAAGVMAQAILKSQLPCKPAPVLYALLDRFLKMLPASPMPLALTSSFLLKMLRLEGLLSMDALPASFSASEQEILRALTLSRSFKTLSEQAVPPSLAEKVYDHFARCTEN